MPNHVTNKIILTEVDENQARKIYDTIHDESGWFDFNTLIPMPDHIYRGDLSMENIKRLGKNNWYDWSIENWGTKWNSYDNKPLQKGKEGWEFVFETAWNAPYPVINAFARKFKTPFIFKWIVEGFDNYGIEKWVILDNRDLVLTDGRTFDDNELPDLRFELWGITKEEWESDYSDTKDESEGNGKVSQEKQAAINHFVDVVTS